MLNQSDVLSKKYVRKNKISFLWTPLVLVILFYTIISTERFSILGFGVQAYLDLFLFTVIMLAISYFRIQAMQKNRTLYELILKTTGNSSE
jgi:hypothetical protein